MYVMPGNGCVVVTVWVWACTLTAQPPRARTAARNTLTARQDMIPPDFSLICGLTPIIHCYR
jgi:hypothetical protein